MHVEEAPDAGWTAALAGSTTNRAERAIAEAAGEGALFRHLAREHDREGRASYIEIDAPLELHALVRLLRPRHVVEVGVSSGVSSAYLLSALERNGSGTLHSIDLPRPSPPTRKGGRPRAASWSLPAGRSSGWAVPFRLRRRWDLRLGDKAEVLPILAEELPRIDLFVYDVPHEDRTTRRELARLAPLLGEGSVVIIDHGPSGGLCAALRSWARAIGVPTVRREGTGLFGARTGKSPLGAPSGSRAPESPRDAGPRPVGRPTRPGTKP